MKIVQDLGNRFKHYLNRELMDSVVIVGGVDNVEKHPERACDTHIWAPLQAG